MVNISNAYFKAHKSEDNVWIIKGEFNELMYLVEGTEKAMLIDTGMGIGNLKEFVEGLTSLPIIVVNTHGHPDHGGGNSNFDEVYLNPKDYDLKDIMCSYEYRLNDLILINNGDINAVPKHILQGLVTLKEYNVKPLSNGQTFDLGNRKLEVIEIPGHTAGSVGLLDSKNKILFSGDTIIGTPVWMHLEHSLSIEVYLESLLKIKIREDEFEKIFPGHLPSPISKELLFELIDCAKSVIKGTSKGFDVRTFAGEGLMFSNGSAKIIYKKPSVKIK